MISKNKKILSAENSDAITDVDKSNILESFLEDILSLYDPDSEFFGNLGISVVDRFKDYENILGFLGVLIALKYIKEMEGKTSDLNFLKISKKSENSEIFLKNLIYKKNSKTKKF